MMKCGQTNYFITTSRPATRYKCGGKESSQLSLLSGNEMLCGGEVCYKYQC